MSHMKLSPAEKDSHREESDRRCALCFGFRLPTNHHRFPRRYLRILLAEEKRISQELVSDLPAVDFYVSLCGCCHNEVDEEIRGSSGFDRLMRLLTADRINCDELLTLSPGAFDAGWAIISWPVNKLVFKYGTRAQRAMAALNLLRDSRAFNHPELARAFAKEAAAQIQGRRAPMYRVIRPDIPAVMSIVEAGAGESQRAQEYRIESVEQYRVAPRLDNSALRSSFESQRYSAELKQLQAGLGADAARQRPTTLNRESEIAKAIAVAESGFEAMGDSRGMDFVYQSRGWEELALNNPDLARDWCARIDSSNSMWAFAVGLFGRGYSWYLQALEAFDRYATAAAQRRWKESELEELEHVAVERIKNAVRDTLQSHAIHAITKTRGYPIPQVFYERILAHDKAIGLKYGLTPYDSPMILPRRLLRCLESLAQRLGRRVILNDAAEEAMGAMRSTVTSLFLFDPKTVMAG